MRRTAHRCVVVNLVDVFQRIARWFGCNLGTNSWPSRFRRGFTLTSSSLWRPLSGQQLDSGCSGRAISVSGCNLRWCFLELRDELGDFMRQLNAIGRGFTRIYSLYFNYSQRMGICCHFGWLVQIKVLFSQCIRAVCKYVSHLRTK